MMIAADSHSSALISDPVFRSCLVVAAATMLVLAGTLVLRQMTPDRSTNRMLTIISLGSATVTLLAFVVGLIASGG
jgi:hypothetical protein